MNVWLIDDRQREKTRLTCASRYRFFDDAILAWVEFGNKANPTNARIFPTNVATACPGEPCLLTAEACASAFVRSPQPTPCPVNRADDRFDDCVDFLNSFIIWMFGNLVVRNL